MKKNILTIFIILFSLNGFCQLDNDSIRNEYNKRLLLDTINGVYIPKNLDDCLKQIDIFFDDSTKNIIKLWTEEEFCTNAHFGFGMGLRNSWYLWGGSRLSKYFNDMGIFHPDDMSGIILTSYYRYLTKQKIEFKKQIKYYKSYWQSFGKREKREKQKKPEKKFEAKTSEKDIYYSLDSALKYSDDIIGVRIIGYKKIPSAIRKFKDLNTLSIENCLNMNFKRAFGFLSNFPNLKELRLWNNERNNYPKNIGKLVQLEELWISDDGISILPNEIMDLFNLKSFYVTGCPKIYLDILFGQLVNLVNLEDLSLWDNDLKEIPFNISKLTQLKELDFWGNLLTEIPEPVKLLHNLESLWLYNNHIELLNITANDLPSLQHIYLDDNNLEAFPMDLIHLKSLMTVDMEYNYISEIPDEIINLNYLLELNLRGNNLTEEQKEKLKILLPNTELKF